MANVKRDESDEICPNAEWQRMGCRCETCCVRFIRICANLCIVWIPLRYGNAVRISISGHNFSMNLIVVALDQLKIAKSRISRIVERKGKWKRRRGDMLHRSTCNSVRE